MQEHRAFVRGEAQDEEDLGAADPQAALTEATGQTTLSKLLMNNLLKRQVSEHRHARSNTAHLA